MAIQEEKIAHPELVGGEQTTLHSHAGGGGEAFPVGSVFLAVVNTNPATLLGYGTWSQIAQGQFLVGQKSSDADFDTPEETGGEKTHILTVAEMPAHTHTILMSASGTSNLRAEQGTTSGTNTQTTSSAGGDGAHNNLPPYLVAYIWKRVS